MDTIHEHVIDGRSQKYHIYSLCNYANRHCVCMCLGHLECKDECVPKKLLVCAPEHGKRTAEGQRLRWSDVVTGTSSVVV